MDLSGIIFVVLALAWAVYLVPKALKHHDEAARTRSIDKFSTAMRVLARREPVSPSTGSGTGRRDSRLVVSPARAADNPRVLTPSEAAAPGTASVGRPVVPAARRAAARAAARRRRRILSFLVLATLVVTGLAWFAIVPRWSVPIPGGLTLLYLLLCRTQVRRERNRSWEADLESVAEEPEEPAVRRVAARVEAPYGTPKAPAAHNAQGFVEVEADDDTLSLPAVVDAVVVPTEDGGSLWDPLPVTLPTYVAKSKAKRTVRTISLDDPDTCSAGRSADDSKLVAENGPAEPAAVEAPDEESVQAVEPPRAVGS